MWWNFCGKAVDVWAESSFVTLLRSLFVFRCLASSPFSLSPSCFVPFICSNIVCLRFIVFSQFDSITLCSAFWPFVTVDVHRFKWQKRRKIPNTQRYLSFKFVSWRMLPSSEQFRFGFLHSFAGCCWCRFLAGRLFSFSVPFRLLSWLVSRNGPCYNVSSYGDTCTLH